ncbi:MAG: ABC transporter permease [Lysobacteraceae bacterium]
MLPYWNLTRRFLRQDLEGRFRGNIAGAAWALVGPVLQLSVFYAVFVHIFKARIPGLEGAGYLAFLALGFWPWFAFSEAVTRSTTAIQDHAGLIGKVALPRSVLVVARVLGAFVLHGVGFALVLLLLPLLGVSLQWQGLPIAVMLWLPLLLLALGAGFAAASIQIFVRDFSQIVAHLLQIGFFMTPILFSREMVPALLRPVLDVNPMTGIVQGTRDALIGDGAEALQLPASVGIALLCLALGYGVFRRCDRYFEDFL